jgi:hypothetical protein
MGKAVQPLQSVNCHDSHAHGHERHGPFTRLVGVWMGWFWLGSTGSSWFGFVVCSRCETCVHGPWFGYRGETYELWSFWLQG